MSLKEKCSVFLSRPPFNTVSPMQQRYIMEHSPSCEASISSSSQEIPCILKNPKVHYCVHNSLPLVPILRQTKRAHAPSTDLVRTLFNIILPPPDHSLPSRLFSSGFPTKTHYKPLLPPIHATYPAHLTLTDVIVRLIFGEEYRPGTSPRDNLLHSPVAAPHLGPSVLFSNFLSLCPSM
jgi:hypothetical protein